MSHVKVDFLLFRKNIDDMEPDIDAKNEMERSHASLSR